MMRARYVGLVLLVVFAWFQVSAPAAVVMNVDFDNAGAGPTQAGYTQYEAGTSPQTIAGIEVSLGGHQSRDRGDFTNPIADLARDFIFSTAVITFGSVGNELPAGLYKFTGYHHDVTAAAASGNYTVTDEERTSELVLSTRSSTGTPADAADIATQEVYIRSDGVNSVVLNVGGIDGFDLETVTAPAELKVDNFGANYDLQSGFQAYDPVSENLEVHYYTQAGNDDVMTVEYSMPGRLTRNYALTHELEDLLEDYVIVSGADITVTLRGLKSGTVTMKTYHHGNPGHGGSYDILVGAATAVSGVSSGSGDVPTITEFEFDSDGVSDVVVTLDNVSGFTMLNGFELSVVADTSTGAVIILR